MSGKTPETTPDAATVAEQLAAVLTEQLLTGPPAVAAATVTEALGLQHDDAHKQLAGSVLRAWARSALLAKMGGLPEELTGLAAEFLAIARELGAGSAEMRDLSAVLNDVKAYKSQLQSMARRGLELSREVATHSNSTIPGREDDADLESLDGTGHVAWTLEGVAEMVSANAIFLSHSVGRISDDEGGGSHAPSGAPCQAGLRTGAEEC